MILKIIKRLCRGCVRAFNQLCTYDFPEEGGGWIKYNCNPVLGDAQTGSMFDPFVRIVNNEYVMCVSRRKTHTLEFYRSSNGINWTNPITVLSGIDGSSWETEVNRGSFVLKDGRWYLWYTGQHDGRSCIGLVISEDGMKFKRHSDVPVLTPELQFEGVAVMNPCVLWNEDEKMYQMWYAAGENYEPDVLCYAESQDGVQWKKNAAPILTADKQIEFQKAKVGACDILKLKNGQYCMAYIAYENTNVARIALAYSEDGVSSWVYKNDTPILSPGRGKWDCNAVYKPTLCFDQQGESIFLWYNGRKKHCERIGLARCSVKELK